MKPVALSQRKRGKGPLILRALLGAVVVGILYLRDSSRSKGLGSAFVLPVHPAGDPEFKVVVRSEVPLSSVECDGDRWETRICRVSNLYIAGRRAVFVAKDPSQRLPEARLHEYGGSPPGSIPKHPVNGLLQVVGQEQAAQLFTSFGGSTPGKLQLAVVDKGVVHQIFHWFNWWHLVDDETNLWYRFCRYLGLCTLKDYEGQATAVLYINEPERHLPFHEPARDLYRCHGPMLYVDHQGSLEAQNRTQPVVWVKQALLGGGPEIQHYSAGIDPGYEALRRINDSMRERHYRFIKTCAGLPEEGTPPRSAPNIIAVNREQQTGRGILNMAEILDTFVKRAPGHLPLGRVETVYFENSTFATFQQQVRTFSDADILLMQHGAATGNVMFMPKKSVGVILSADKGQRDHERTVFAKMPKPNYNMTFIPLICDDKLEPVMSKIKKADWWLGLSDKNKLFMLANASATSGRAITIAYTSKLGNWVNALYYYNLRPEKNEAVSKLIQALEVWYEKNA